MERKRRSRRLRQLATTTSPVARRQQQQQQNNSPCMDLVDTPNSLKNNKGGALLNLGPLKSEEGAADLSQLEEFTCAICLDKPDTLVDLATISGCSHKFCFDCIDKWAETENKCPCCKQRFRTIDRVQNLPPTPTSTSRSGGKRKRGSSSNNSGSNTRRRTGEAAASSTGGGEGATAAAAAAPRVNSRTVEDRTQQSVPPNISFALLESILNSAFMGPGRSTGGGRGQTTFRFPVPPSMAGNPGDLDDMAGMLRMILQDSMGPGPGGRVTIQVRTTTVPHPDASPSRASSSGGSPSPRRRNSSPHRRPTLFPNLSSPSNNRSDNNGASSNNSRSTRQLSSAGRRSRSRPARGSSNGNSGV